MAYDLQLQVALQLDKASADNLARQVQSKLSGIQISGVDTKVFNKLQSEIDTLKGNLDQGEKKAKTFFERVQGKGTSFAAYTVASTAILKLTGAVAQATRESIKFESELIKISQVTDRTTKGIQSQSKALFDISKKYNVTITKVAELTRTLTQTGLSFRDAAKGAEILAKTSLLATFDSLTNTTEGLIATMQTFNLTVEKSGKVLEKINAVSKAFAVESSDIVSAIRRTGGAFSAAGGQVEELIALFTSVRSTSRESAETIATGFRTIFGRLQRPKTIEYFKKLGIQLETAEGQFIGPLKSIEAISEGLDKLGIKAGSVRFAEVVEQIGGIRQLSRVIPLLEQYNKTQRALGVQNRSSGEAAKDLEKAQKGLGYQIGVVKQEFSELISEVVNSSSFKFLAETFLGITKTVIALTRSLKPLLPLITAIATVKIGRGISSLLSGGFSLKGMKESMGFASGGMVPGVGDRDTVPAMLTPGEFVIRKSAVKAFGANRLAKINKYAKGGNVVAANKVKVIDGDSVGIDYASDPYYTSTRLIGVDAYEINKGTKAERAKGNKAREIATQHYRGKTDLLPLFKDHGQDKFGRPKFKDDALANKLLKEDVAIPYSGSGQRATKGTKLEGYNYGGLVQKFAEGGKAKEKDFGQIFLSGGSDRIEARYNPNDTRTGSVNAKKWKDGIWTVGLSMATKGYGPKLYDVVMEAVTELGGMLTSDRATVSGAAKSVWDYYFKNRGDVKKIPLPRDAWTGNYEMIDEKLRGPEDTWPPKDDPAWALQSGYKKSPSLINDPNSVKRIKSSQSSAKTALDYFAARSLFAEGGSVGTDTVPALLTPGEFVINRKSAQSFGYGNLEKINRYADGGVVLSKQEKKRRREEYKSQQLGTSLSRGERTGGIFAGIEAKYNKILDEERQLIRDAYKEKIATAIMEKKSTAQIYKERNRQLADATKANRLGMGAAKQGAQQTIDKKKLQDASKALNILGDEAKNASKEVKDLGEENKKAKVSIAELIFYQQAAAQALENFAGIKINEDALQQSSVKAGQFDMISQGTEFFVKNFDKWNNTLKQAAVNMRAYNGKYSGIVKGLGNKLLKTTGSLDKIGPKLLGLAKGFNIVAKALAIFELGGGLLDAIFSKDYKKAKEGFIESGDVAKAGAAASKEYNQRFFRGIPVIGGFLSAMGEATGLVNMELDARGKLFVATAELAATMVKTSRDIDRAREDLSKALIRGNNKEIQAALKKEREALDTQKEGADKLFADAQKLETERTSPLGTALAAGAAAGTVGAGVGAALAGVPTLGVAAGPGAAAGFALAGIPAFFTTYISEITRGTEDVAAAYDQAAKVFREQGEKAVARIEFLGDNASAVLGNVISLGGSFEQGLKAFKQKFGDAAYEELFGTIEDISFPQLEATIQSLNVEIENGRQALDDYATKITEAQKAVDDASWFWTFFERLFTGSSTRDRAQAELSRLNAERDREQAELDAAKAEQQKLIEMQATTKNAYILARARAIENAAMKQSIMLMKERIATFDKLDIALLGLSASLEEVNAAQTGKPSRQQILDRRGIDMDTATLDMDAEQVLRNDRAYKQMEDAIARINPMLAGSLRVGRTDMQLMDHLLEEIEGTMSADIIEEARQTAESSGQDGDNAPRDAGQVITDLMIERMGLRDQDMSAPVRQAFEEIGERIAKGEDISVVIEDMKEKLTKDQVALIEKGQEVYKEYLQMESELFEKRQALTEMRIEQIDREYALTMQVYDAEMDYLKKRLALTEKVDDVLEELPVGPGRAAAIGARAAQRRQSRMEGIGNARTQAGLPADTRGREGDFFDWLGGYESAAQAAMGREGGQTEGEARALAQTFAELEKEGQLLLHTLQDEIDAEQEYLDGLIEMAKAQQEYTQTLNDAQGDLARELVTGTEDEVEDMLQGLNAALIAGQQGSFAGIPEDLKKQVFSVFDAFGDVVIPGLGVTGRDAQREITKNELMRNYGVDQATAEQLASKAVKDRVPIDERMKEMIELQEKKILELLQREKMLNDYMARLQSINNQLFAASVNRFDIAVQAFAAKIEDFVDNSLRTEIIPIIVQPKEDKFELPEWMKNEDKAPLTKNDLTFDADGAVKVWEVHPAIEGENDPDIRGDIPSSTEEEHAAATQRGIRDQEIYDRWIAENQDTVAYNNRDSWLDTIGRWWRGEGTRAGSSTGGWAKGGLVYAANGGAMDMSNIGFKPKGTDTIPAMLSPGEFVVRKKAVDKIGLANLEKMNREGGLQEPEYHIGGIQDPGDTILSILDTVGLIDADKAGFFTAALGALDGDAKDIAQLGNSIREGWNSGGPLGPAQLNLPKLNPEEKLAYEKNKALEFKKQFFQGTMLEGYYAKGGYVKPTYLAQGGPPEGYMGRSQQNLRRFGWSDPRFEQGGLRGLDPSSPYYQDALAYWQYIMAWQNQYNQRAANWNNGIRAQQMQAMQMMLTNWGYYAKGGYVKPTYLRNGGITASPLNNDVLTPQVLTDMRNGNLIPTDTVRSGESTMRKVLGNTVTDAAFGAITEDLQDSADIFDWPGMLGVNRYANESRLDENGVELPYHMQPREVRMSRFDDPSRRNVFEQGLFDMADDTLLGLPFALGHQAIEAFRGYDMDQKLERLKADRARKEEFAAFEEEELEKKILRNLKSIDQQDNAKKELKMKKLLYDEKYGGDISLEDVQSFEAGKVKTAQWEKDDKAPGGYRRTGEYDIKPGLQEQQYAEMMRQQQQAASAADEIPTVETPQPTPTPPKPAQAPPKPAQAPPKPAQAPPKPAQAPPKPAQAPSKPQKPASGVPLKPLAAGSRVQGRPTPGGFGSGFGVQGVNPKNGQRINNPIGSDGNPAFTTYADPYLPTGMSFGGGAMTPSSFQNPQQPIAQGMLTDLGFGPDVEAGQNPNGITLGGANTLANQAGLRTDIASFTNTGAAGRIQEQFNSQLSDIMKRRPGFIGNNTAYSITPNNQQQGMAPQLPSRSSSLLMASQQFGQQQNSPMSGGPTTMQLQGSQEITIRLPDIQAMVNQNITGMIYSTIATYFNQLAGYVRNASNFEDLANEMSNGMQTTQTQQVGGGQ